MIHLNNTIKLTLSDEDKELANLKLTLTNLNKRLKDNLSPHIKSKLLREIKDVEKRIAFISKLVPVS